MPRHNIPDNEVWAWGGALEKPDSNRFEKGNESGQTAKPPKHTHFNWESKRADENMQYILRNATMPWDKGEKYPVGARVTRASKEYECIKESTNNDPATSPTYWEWIDNKHLPDATTTEKGVSRFATDDEAINAVKDLIATNPSAVLALLKSRISSNVGRDRIDYAPSERAINDLIRGEIPSASSSLGDTDLNDLNSRSDAGFYYQSSNSNTAGNNYPSGHAGALLVQRTVLGSKDGVVQTYIDYSTGVIYSRAFDSVSWTPWASTYSSENKPSSSDVSAQPELAMPFSTRVYNASATVNPELVNSKGAILANGDAWFVKLMCTDTSLGTGNVYVVEKSSDVITITEIAISGVTQNNPQLRVSGNKVAIYTAHDRSYPIMTFMQEYSGFSSGAFASVSNPFAEMKAFYSNWNKPAPNDIGAVKKVGGDVMTGGALQIQEFPVYAWMTPPLNAHEFKNGLSVSTSNDASGYDGYATVLNVVGDNPLTRAFQLKVDTTGTIIKMRTAHVNAPDTATGLYPWIELFHTSNPPKVDEISGLEHIGKTAVGVSVQANDVAGESYQEFYDYGGDFFDLVSFDPSKYETHIYEPGYYLVDVIVMRGAIVGTPTGGINTTLKVNEVQYSNGFVSKDDATKRNPIQMKVVLKLNKGDKVRVYSDQDAKWQAGGSITFQYLRPLDATKDIDKPTKQPAKPRNPRSTT